MTLELLSPSSIAILTKIGCFSTQSVIASPVDLIILISYRFNINLLRRSRLGVN